MYTDLLVPIDGSKLSKKAVAEALTLAKALKARVAGCMATTLQAGNVGRERRHVVLTDSKNGIRSDGRARSRWRSQGRFRYGSRGKGALRHRARDLRFALAGDSRGRENRRSARPS